MLLRDVAVQVPATSANLGPGFDALGIAVDIVDELIVRAVEGGPDDVVVGVTGHGAGSLPTGADHLVVRAAHSAFAAAGVTPPALRLECNNRIPHGRGLGSSAAATVAGLVAGRALLPDPAVLTDDDLLGLATGMEGHPDNAAPALLGGLTLAWTGGGGPRAVPLPVHPELRLVVCIPDGTLSTEAARGLLPTTVPHTDATGQAARAALLVEALARRPDLLLEATEDRLHQEQRRAAMPATLALVDRLRADGLAAVVSGAGPSVLVLSAADVLPGVTASAHAAPGAWDVRQVSVGHPVRWSAAENRC